MLVPTINSVIKIIMAAASFVRRHAAAPTKGRAIRCTVDGSTPKRLAIPRTPSPVRLRSFPRPPKSFALILGPPKPGPDSFFDRCALELGKHAHHLKHGLAARRRGGRGIANPRFFR